MSDLPRRIGIHEEGPRRLPDRAWSHRGGGQGPFHRGAGHRKAPRAFIDYAASKGAVDTMTIGLAAELAGAGVRVNGARPGMIDTDVHASDKASYVTGATLDVAGGVR